LTKSPDIQHWPVLVEYSAYFFESGPGSELAMVMEQAFE